MNFMQESSMSTPEVRKHSHSDDDNWMHPKRDTVNSTATKALKLASEYSTPLSPSVYAVWYAYASGKPAKLVAAVDKLRDSGSKRIDEYDLAHIYQTFLSHDELSRRYQEYTGNKIDSEMNNATSLIREYINKTDLYNDALNSCNKELSYTMTIKEIRDICEGLVRENTKVIRHSMDLNGKLNQTRMQVQSLRIMLKKSREAEFIDDLSQVYNRKYFDQKISNILNTHKENRELLCVSIADLDNFKSTNDTYGHQVGDEVIRFFAKLVKDNIKSTDFVARYGGEEFVMVFPVTNRESALKAVTRIKESLEAKNFVITNSRKSIGKLSCSFGLAEVREDDTVESLIGRADSCLYEAKRKGKNRIVCDDMASD